MQWHFFHALSLLILYFLYLLAVNLLPVYLHCAPLRVSHALAAAGRQLSVNAIKSCQENAIEKRITLIVAWWGSDMRAESGAPGQGPCRSAPRPKTEPNTLARIETAQSPDPGPPQAGPSLRAETSHAAPRDAPLSQVYKSSSVSTATSAAESDSASELEPAASVTADCKSDCSLLSAHLDTEPSHTELMWLQQCQLPSDQQASECLHQNCQMPAGSGLGDSADQVAPNQGGNSSTALLERKVHAAPGSQATCHWHPAKGDSLTCVAPSAKGDSPPIIAPSEKGYNPPSISPVWLPVSLLQNEKQCDDKATQQGGQQDYQQDHRQDDRQDDWQDACQDCQQGNQQGSLHGCQHDAEGSRQEMLPLQEGRHPAAKRHKGKEQCGHRGAATCQQQVVLPLPPLRFFVRSADEICWVYEPRTASLVSDESGQHQPLHM